MTALAKLTLVEAKLLTRDRMNLFWGLIFPAVLLLVLGFAFPGFREADPATGGRLVDLYGPIVLALGVATVGLSTLPAYLAGYRERGLLRRLATTPVGPGRLLTAHLVVQVAMAAVAALLAIAVGALAFGIPLPRNPVGFALAFALAAASLFAIGLLVGGVAGTTGAAQGLGMLLYFPMLFFAGVYLPREAMPETLRRISDLTPAGAAVQALQDSWSGAMPRPSLVVMAGFAIGAGLLAAWWFRWE